MFGARGSRAKAREIVRVIEEAGTRGEHGERPFRSAVTGRSAPGIECGVPSHRSPEVVLNAGLFPPLDGLGHCCPKPHTGRRQRACQQQITYPR